MKIPKTNAELASVAFCDIVAANADRENFTLRKYWAKDLEKEVPSIVLSGVRRSSLDLSHLEHFMLQGGKLVHKDKPSMRVQLRFRMA